MQKKFETRQIDEATPDELRAYATQFLGIQTEGDTDGEVMAKVRAANEGDTIFVAVATDEPADQTGSPPPAPATENVGGLLGGLGREDPKVQLTLHAEDRDGVVVNRHKEVGVNGRVWLLQRGISITIPYRVYLALELAEREAITHDGEGNVRVQRVKNTPYNIERMPGPEEIREWHARVDSQFVP